MRMVKTALNLVGRAAAMANELSIFVPTAIRAIMSRLAPRIEAAAGGSIRQTVDLNPAIANRIAAGEAFDIGLTNPPYVNALIQSGHADAASHRSFGRISLALGRKAGVEHALGSNPQEIADILRAAKSIAYTGAGTSGRIFLEAADRLGVSEAITSKSRAMDGGAPAQSVAAGEIEIAVAPLTTLMATPGVVPVALFPEALGAHIDISVFLSTAPPQSATRVTAFLTASDLDAELAEAGIARFALT